MRQAGPAYLDVSLFRVPNGKEDNQPFELGQPASYNQALISFRSVSYCTPPPSREYKTIQKNINLLGPDYKKFFVVVMNECYGAFS